MIRQNDIAKIVEGYDKSNLTIAVLGGHSALDVCHGAKKLGFKTLAICQKGRDKTYSAYYKTRDGKGCVDEVILVEKFGDVVKPEIQEELRKRNAIMVQNRYFWVYCDYKEIENNFHVPIFGNREMLRREERDVEGNQYEMLKKAEIRIPKIIRQGGEKLTDEELGKRIDAWFKENKTPLLVKAAELERGYERDFFLITTGAMEYQDQREERIKNGYIKESIDSATIEEFVIGPQINFNYFYSPLTKELEVMGTDTRRQSNLDGFLRLPANQQMVLNGKGYKPTMVENGHIACTTKESIIEKMFELGEKFVEMSKKECAPMIGPFALQGAYVSEKGKEEMVVFDVSMRIPGSPGTRFTPYTGYLYGETISYGERIGMEISEALKKDRLIDLLT